MFAYFLRTKDKKTPTQIKGVIGIPQNKNNEDYNQMVNLLQARVSENS